MAVLRESPWYQQILQEGRLEGKQEGRLEGLLSGISLGLELKFGQERLALMSEISQVENVELLTEILAAVKTVNYPDELRQVYQIN